MVNCSKLEGGGKGRLCLAVNTATRRNSEEARESLVLFIYRAEVIILNSGLVITADSWDTFEIAYCLRQCVEMCSPCWLTSNSLLYGMSAT